MEKYSVTLQVQEQMREIALYVANELMNREVAFWGCWMHLKKQFFR